MAVEVKLATVKSESIAQTEEYTATVESDLKNNISPNMAYRIERILVDVGDQVSKGQLLVQLDASSLNQLKLQIDNQKVEFNRTSELYKVGGASKAEYDNAKMQIEVMESQYNQMSRNTQLYAPMSGVVTARNYDNGDMYEGSLRDGKFEGYGIYRWADGSTYQGLFHKGLQEKEGVATYVENSNTYKGQWHLGKRHGKGVLSMSNGDTYEGDWENDRRTGFGVFRSTVGDVYMGQWLDDLRHGRGTYQYANGDVYIGQWVNGEKEGYGCYRYANGAIYEGAFLHSEFEGEGTYLYTDGAVYIGHFHHGVRHGYGVYRTPTGQVLAGNWTNNCLDEKPSKKRKRS